MNALAFWFRAAGRTNRKVYWRSLAILLAAGWLADRLNVALTLSGVLPVGVGLTVLLGLSLGAAWLWTCLMTRRLHDMGRSGWWQVIPIAVMTACLALAEPAWAAQLGLDETGMTAAGLLAGAVYLGFAAWLGIVRGSPATNRFGPPA